MKNEMQTEILNHRIEYLQQQIYDTQLNIKIFERILDEMGKNEDRQAFHQEHEKLRRFELALETLVKERA